MEFFTFTVGDFAVFIFLGVSLVICHMVTMSRIDTLEGKVDLLVELAVGRSALEPNQPAAPAPAKETGADAHR